jgi:exosortase/archaeosortase family protein
MADKLPSRPVRKRTSAHRSTPSREPRRRVVRFAVLFGLLLFAFEVTFALVLAQSAPFLSYLEVNARCATTALRTCGVPCLHDGTAIAFGGVGVDVRRGCDGLQATGLYAAAILAFPAGALYKVLGIVAGTLVLLPLNVARISSLLVLRLHVSEDSFQTVHVVAWPLAFMLASLLLWVVWARLRPLGSSR